VIDKLYNKEITCDDFVNKSITSFVGISKLDEIKKKAERFNMDSL